MAVFKKGDSYVAQVYAGTVEGKKRYLSKSARTLKEARALEAELKVAIATRATQPTKGGKTVGDLLDAYMAQAVLEPTTAKTYTSAITKWIVPTIGHLSLRAVTPEHLDKLYAKMRRAGCSTSWIRQPHYVLRKAFDQGVRWRWMPSNPALLVHPGKLRQQEVTAPSLKAVSGLLKAAAAEDADLAAILLLAAVTGARRSEVCGLRWSDLDGKVLTIRRAVVDVGGQRVVKSTKTRQVRRVPLDKATLDALASMRLRASERLLACGARLSEDAYVYAADVEGSTPTNPSVLSNRLRRLADRHGLDVRMHGLRHLAATHMIGAGVDVRTVSRRLGHSDPGVTLRVYAHQVIEADVAAGEVMGGLLRPKAV